MKKIEKKIYKKDFSFENFISNSRENVAELNSKLLNILDNKKNLLKLKTSDLSVVEKIKEDLNSNILKKHDTFYLKPNVIDELKIIKEEKIIEYLVSRYKYEIFPKKKIVDDFPPVLQIEPSSICNYRCVFCFETDKTFTNKKNGFMGQMKFDLFKKIIDDAEGNINFLTLASRGEPLVCKDIDKMLQYTEGKFLNVKLNTNASLLSEKNAHSILSGGVNTLIFSADAADEELYSKLRVNGKLKTVLKNIEQFKKIQNKHYSKKKIITRVSGVKVNSDQKIEDMEKLWKGLVDQVVFVKYNPWENSYEKKSNSIEEPCSDLWRRMFIWWDGKSNPCDVDYKSLLEVGNFPDLNIKELWNSERYSSLRKEHLSNNRKSLKPCMGCVVT